MTQFEVRPARPQDAAAVAALHVRSFLATYPHLSRTRQAAENGFAGRLNLWRRRISEPDHGTLVAAAGDLIGGFALVGPSADDDSGRCIGQVHSIHVDPELGGRGVGRLLMEAGTAALLTSGYRTATLWVVADNVGARGFYERLGWTTDGSSRMECLGVGDEEGDEVEIVRYRLELGHAR